MSAASSATLPPMQRVMWTCKPGKVEEATCSKARLYDAARPQFSPYIGEVVKLRSQFAEERRQAMLRASNLKHKYFVGQRVVVKGIGPAVVSYIGEVAEYDGELMGVQFPGPLGNSDGSLGWMRYFKAEPDHAAFVRFSAVEPLWHNTALPPLPQEVARIPSEASQKQRALAEAMSPGVRRLRRAERNRREKQDAVVGRLRTACRERDAVAERHERQVLAERAHFVENEARTLLKQRHIEEARRLEHDLASYYRDTARRVGAASVQLNQMRNAWQRLPPLKSAPQHSDLSARTEDDLRKEAV
ncbi:hypothetical protein DIPPA_06908 [Diplonema papillatum]|nr:hypothetical protein DIPPA_06908 [Diplonema papillatum]